ncbi:hypothetical protein ACVHL3_002593 [Escherichia coli]|uniref:hypothetical protein n=1 Tax=Escherichia coli TaxID=562 RepID=UPI00146147B7|nr:hypothetical protein [Escherichia coli]ELR3257026.1 hypothetical protein [Escherichia coli]ELR3350645.1 hypothetical protein [Escherichia coli]ELR3355347.1 hypothetical protein [Escherichia coli]ELR3360145.1 hypothetical protein [Escherichia coli]MBI9859378.1 hypothetical protein [Escherichia coli]
MKQFSLACALQVEDFELAVVNLRQAHDFARIMKYLGTCADARDYQSSSGTPPLYPGFAGCKMPGAQCHDRPQTTVARYAGY